MELLKVCTETFWGMNGNVTCGITQYCFNEEKITQWIKEEISHGSNVAIHICFPNPHPPQISEEIPRCQNLICLSIPSLMQRPGPPAAQFQLDLQQIVNH